MIVSRWWCTLWGSPVTTSPPASSPPSCWEPSPTSPSWSTLMTSTTGETKINLVFWDCQCPGSWDPWLLCLCLPLWCLSSLRGSQKPPTPRLTVHNLVLFVKVFSPAHRRLAAVLPDQHDDQHLHPHPGGLPQEVRARVREGARGGQADHCQGWRGVHARRGDDWDGNWLQMVKLHRNEHKRPKWLKNGAITWNTKVHIITEDAPNRNLVWDISLVSHLNRLLRWSTTVKRSTLWRTRRRRPLRRTARSRTTDKRASPRRMSTCRSSSPSRSPSSSSSATWSYRWQKKLFELFYKTEIRFNCIHTAWEREARGLTCKQPELIFRRGHNLVLLIPSNNWLIRPKVR